MPFCGAGCWLPPSPRWRRPAPARPPVIKRGWAARWRANRRPVRDHADGLDAERDGRRPADAAEQDDRRQCGQLGRPHDAGRSGQGRGPGRHPRRTGPVHRVRTGQQRVRGVAAGHGREAAEAREPGQADRHPDLPRGPRPAGFGGAARAGRGRRRHGQPQDRQRRRPSRSRPTGPPTSCSRTAAAASPPSRPTTSTSRTA